MPQQRILHDRYRVDDMIGRGGMADVLQGTDLLLDRTVAIKMMRPDLARDPQFQARFRQEARSAAALNHPAIVAVYDTGTATLEDGHHHRVDCPYLVMEHVDGRTLRELIHEGEVTWRQAVDWTRGLLSALEHSHEQRIIHRDVKPANVMVTRSGAVKVMDFGIARALSDTSAHTEHTQAVVGTALYIAPEQAQGQRVDARSDLYAAGCLLFELLTGRPPFTGDSPLAVAYQHVREEPPAVSAVDPTLPPVFDALLDRALRKDPAERFQSAAQFREALDDAAARAEAGETGASSGAGGGVMGGAGIVGGAGVVRGTDRADSADGADRAAAEQSADRRPAPEADTPTSVLPMVDAGPSAGALAASAARGETAALPAVPEPPVSPSHAVAGAAVPGSPSAAQLAAAASVEAAPTGSTAVVTGAQPVVAPPSSGPRPARRGLLALVVLLALLALTAGLFLPRLWDPGQEEVEVPQVVGLSVDAAEEALQSAGLDSHTVETVRPGAAPGTVVGADPGEGTPVHPGTDVELTVAQSGADVVLPGTLRGTPEATARQELARLGLRVASVDYRPSGDLARGDLVGTEPALGTTVPAGSGVVLHLSDGTVDVPDVTGMTGADARRTLRDQAPDLTVRFQGPAGSDPETGVVALQDPRPGVRVDNRSTLTLITSPEAVPTAAATASSVPTVGPVVEDPAPAPEAPTPSPAPAEPSALPVDPVPTAEPAPSMTPAPVPVVTPTAPGQRIAPSWPEPSIEPVPTI
ncbi:protein kinase domain-containing protein [Micrococcus sp.]|uniref:protein kinase domain-containing protein n=1 Tax=Micrococcus sp. TaxID=1271 RepID=UPI002A912F4E|nr:PASTA domain-containing protein [Micrococcus sp.]MDY6055970.1 PASTA domain-containing protein [Micrococcus sp.]